MSNPNDYPNPEVSSDNIDIDETGKVVIKDPGLASMSEELSPEELETVTGGLAVKNNVCGSGC